MGRVQKTVNKILKPYREIIKELTGSYTNIKITMGTSFCCYCDDVNDLEIVIPLTEDKYSAEAFYNKMTKKLEKVGITDFYSSEILSFLHEIGHIYTYNKWNDWKYKKITPIIPKIQGLYFIRNSRVLTNLCFKWYWNLALEKNADNWAIDFIKLNPAKVQEWQDKIQKNYKSLEKVLTSKK